MAKKKSKAPITSELPTETAEELPDTQPENDEGDEVMMPDLGSDLHDEADDMVTGVDHAIGHDVTVVTVMDHRTNPDPVGAAATTLRRPGGVQPDDPITGRTKPLVKE